MHLFYLGPENTFSSQAAHLVAHRLGYPAEFVPRLPLENVITSLAASPDPDDLAIIAYYNYLEGLVQESLDLIYEQRLTIVGSQRLPVRFCLGGYLQDESKPQIYSHPKALAQCSAYLTRHYPDLPHVEVASTSAAAQEVAARQSGLAIANELSLRQSGLPLLAEDIGNRKHGRANFTDFFLLGRGDLLAQGLPPAPPAAQTATMVAITPYVDRVGLLADILAQIAYYDLNLAKIHSRPAIDEVTFVEVEPQMFYLEVISAPDTDDFRRCVDALQYKFSPPGGDRRAVRVLGSYPALKTTRDA